MTDEKETYESAAKKRFNELVIDEYADFTKEQFELLVKQREKAVDTPMQENSNAENHN